MRIRKSDLEFQVKEINELMGTPQETYSKVGGKYKSNIGNYHLSWAYGGVKMEQISNDSGGVRTISTGGYGTKKELSYWIGAFRHGILAEQDKQTNRK